jgi:hypothetical protein
LYLTLQAAQTHADGRASALVSRLHPRRPEAGQPVKIPSQPGRLQAALAQPIGMLLRGSPQSGSECETFVVCSYFVSAVLRGD